MIIYQQRSNMFFMFNDKWLVDMYVNLLPSVLEDDADCRGDLWWAHRDRTLSRTICSNSRPCETLACILRMLSASAAFPVRLEREAS